MALLRPFTFGGVESDGLENLFQTTSTLHKNGIIYKLNASLFISTLQTMVPRLSRPGLVGFVDVNNLAEKPNTKPTGMEALTSIT